MSRRRLNQHNDDLLRLAKWINRIALVSCWFVVFFAIAFFLITGNLGLTLLFLSYTPIRYFLFDTAPQKEQKRPPSLDRSIPLTIFVRYLSIEFPISQGNLMADLWGFLVAVCRATINGYALLWFDTFTFAYAIRDQAGRAPIKEDINLIHERDRLDQLDQKADQVTDKDIAKQLRQISKAWKQTAQAQELGQWSFPLRRYLTAGDDFMALKEVGAELIDDKNQLDQKAYAKYKQQEKE